MLCVEVSCAICLPDSDTPDSDIVGTNLYQRYVDREWARRRQGTSFEEHVNCICNLSLADDVIPTEELPTKHSVKDEQSVCDRTPYYDPDIPASRNVPLDARFHPATVERVVPILVCTGVYRPPAKKQMSGDNNADDDAVAGSSSSEEDGEDDVKKVPYHGHRDFPNSAELYKPNHLCDDVCSAVEHILQQEAYE
jgi:hypothetical protein